MTATIQSEKSYGAVLNFRGSGAVEVPRRVDALRTGRCGAGAPEGQRKGAPVAVALKLAVSSEQSYQDPRSC